MIQIYNCFAKKNDLIGKNGKYNLIKICTNAIIEDKLNGVFNLDCRFRIMQGVDKEVYDYIQEDNIIKVRDEFGDEFFRIRSVIKGLKDISVKAIQISLSEFMNLWVNDSRPTDQAGLGALNVLRVACGDTDFNFSSDISNVATAYYMDMSLYDCIYVADNSFLNRWGGEIIRQGFNFSVNANAGIDRGFQIRSRKNLQGFESETNLDKLCTRIVAKGFDTLKLDKFIDSPLINSYSKPFTKIFKYDDITVKSESSEEGFNTIAEAKVELERRAKLEFTQNNVDKIKAYYRINFAELKNTEEYKDYSIAEYSQLGDIVTVIEEVNNINIKVKVVGRKYDVIRGRRLETELSNYNINIKPIKVQDLLNELGQYAQGGNNALSNYITAMLESGLSGSYAIHRKNETLYMDTSDINTAREVFRLNKNGLGFSSTGYYGKYTYGFTRDGKINADLIQVGTLTAILLRSLDGQNWIDLTSGEINFTKGKILGKNLKIDLDLGEILFNSGRIAGHNFNLNLDTGVFECLYGVDRVAIEDGVLKIGDSFTISQFRNDSFYISDLYKDSYYDSLISYQRRDFCKFGNTDIPNVYLDGDNINIRGYKVNLQGTSVTINGSPVQTQISNIENALLMQEGLL